MALQSGFVAVSGWRVVGCGVLGLFADSPSEAAITVCFRFRGLGVEGLRNLRFALATWHWITKPREVFSAVA